MSMLRGALSQALRQQHGSAQLAASSLFASRYLTTSLQVLSPQPHPDVAKDSQAGAPPQQQQQQQQQQHAQAGTSSGSETREEGSSSSHNSQSSSSGGSSTSSSQEGAAGSTGSNSSSSSSTGADPCVEDMTQRVFKSFRSGYQNVRTKMESASKGERDSQLLQEAAKEMQAVFRAGDHIRSATRKYTGPVAAVPSEDGEGGGGPSEIVVTKQRPSTWQTIHEKLGGIPFFGKLGGVKDSSAYKKGKDLYEDMREKYETSDNPAVHKIDDIKDRLVSGSEGSRAMREIRTRDMHFDMNTFVRSVKLDAPVVSKAFLNHDLPTLKLHCGPELLERFSGIFKHFSEQGLFEDPTILFVGDVEVVEIKLLDDDPFAIVQFHCQQLKCTRDKFGNVIEGATDSIQRVYYFWGLQQEKQGVITADGQVLPPRWVIKDMMWQSMLALV